MEKMAPDALADSFADCEPESHGAAPIRFNRSRCAPCSLLRLFSIIYS